MSVKSLRIKKLIGEEFVEDYVDEDTQLVFKHKNGEISIITGCSHNGICNIMSYAKKVTGIDNINCVVGGLHLQSPSEYLLSSTLDYVKKANIKNFYACHDTDFSKQAGNRKDCKYQGDGSLANTFNWE